MKAIKEVFIPIFLWVYFIYSGISFGLRVGKEKIEPSDGIPIQIQLLVYGMSFIMGFGLVFVNAKRNKMPFEGILENIFTVESFEIMERRIRPLLLGAAFFGLGGLVGIVQSAIHEMPVINRQILQMPISVSAGILLGYWICKGKTWRDKADMAGIEGK